MINKPYSLLLLLLSTYAINDTMILARKWFLREDDSCKTMILAKEWSSRIPWARSTMILTREWFSRNHDSRKSLSLWENDCREKRFSRNHDSHERMILASPMTSTHLVSHMARDPHQPPGAIMPPKRIQFQMGSQLRGRGLHLGPSTQGELSCPTNH